MRISRVVGLGLVTSVVALGVASPPGHTAPEAACFGGPAIGPTCGTLTEANLHSLVADMTLAQKVAFVHGQAETTDPQFGCGNTGQPNAFPVINPGATGSALVAGCVGQAGVNNGVKSLGIPPLRQTDGPAGVRLSHQATALPAPVGLTAAFDRAAAADYGTVIGREGRAINQDVLYAPMINQVTIPTAGRNFETLGEDPYLAGELVDAGDQRRPGPGPHRHAQAPRRERLREQPHEHGDQARRALAARARAAGVRGRRPAGPSRRRDVRVQPHQPVRHRHGHVLVRQQPAAQHDPARAARVHRLGADRLRRRSTA